MKLFQFDRKIWNPDLIDYIWQFGIFGNRTLLWVRYENPTNHHWYPGGFHIVFSFLSSSLFGVELNNDKQCLAFEFFTEYSEGWD
jgi:hypothetical protein